MELRHPIDEEIRERLRRLNPNQVEFAKRIGRSQGWLNKFMNGAGHATIDDVIRITAAVIGADAAPLTELERRLLRSFRGIPNQGRREDAVAVFEGIAKSYQREPLQESDAPAAHRPQATSRKGRSKP